MGRLKPHTARMQGVVFIELALTIPLYAMLFLLTVEVSHAIAEYKVLLNQVASASRYLETQSAGNLYGQRTLATCLVVTATPDCSAPAVLTGLTAALVTIQDASDNPATMALQSTGSGVALSVGTSVNLVTVKVTGYRHSLASSTMDIAFSPISATARQVN